MRFCRDDDCLFSPGEVSKHHLGLGCEAGGSTIYNIQNISTEVQSVALLRVSMQANISCSRLKKNLRKHTEETNVRKNARQPGPFFPTQIGFRWNPAGYRRTKRSCSKWDEIQEHRREEEGKKKSFKWKKNWHSGTSDDGGGSNATQDI